MTICGKAALTEYVDNLLDVTKSTGVQKTAQTDTNFLHPARCVTHRYVSHTSQHDAEHVTSQHANHDNDNDITTWMQHLTQY